MKISGRIIPQTLLVYSRALRKNQTPWEAKLWYYLRAGRFYGLRFKRQVQIGKYIYDFSCREKMVVIEADGSQHNEEEISHYDTLKEAFAIKEGYKLLRFWNIDIDGNISGVLERIKEACGV